MYTDPLEKLWWMATMKDIAKWDWEIPLALLVVELTAKIVCLFVFIDLNFRRKLGTRNGI